MARHFQDHLASAFEIRSDNKSEMLTKITNSIITKAYDYVGINWNAGTFTETFTFKTGGSGGTTVFTVVIVYTDATKEQLASVTRVDP